MNKFAAGILAGLAATVVLSIMMVLKSLMGIMPGLNVIAMLAHMAHAHMGTPASPGIGWILHFFIGTVVWGVAFAALFDILPGKTAWQKGIVFSIFAWLLMMIGPMPMAGAGLFGTKLGMPAPVMTLVLHVLFGFVLGQSFRLLRKSA